MAVFTLFQPFSQALFAGTHNLGTGQLRVALTNSEPNIAWDQLSDVSSQPSYTFLSSRDIVTTSSTQTAGVFNLILQNLVLTSTGGSTGPFRWIIIYNDSASGDELIGFADHSSSITLSSGQTYAIGFNQVNGLLSWTM